MCGRYGSFRVDETLLHVPGVGEVAATHGLPPARYNIAPTQTVAVVIGQELRPARWGFAPVGKNGGGGVLFNARAETVQEKPTFRKAFAQGRCILPFDGYYEWRRGQPYWITPGHRFWVAGLYQDGAVTVVTTAATGDFSRIHHRMPRILPDEAIVGWLAEGVPWLVPPELEGWQFNPAAQAVGNVRNDYPELLRSDVLF